MLSPSWFYPIWAKTLGWQCWCWGWFPCPFLNLWKDTQKNAEEWFYNLLYVLFDPVKFTVKINQHIKCKNNNNRANLSTKQYTANSCKFFTQFGSKKTNLGFKSRGKLEKQQTRFPIILFCFSCLVEKKGLKLASCSDCRLGKERPTVIKTKFLTEIPFKEVKGDVCSQICGTFLLKFFR